MGVPAVRAFALGEVQAHHVVGAGIDVFLFGRVSDNVSRRRRHPVQRADDGGIEHEPGEWRDSRHATCIAATSETTRYTTCLRAAAPSSATAIPTRPPCSWSRRS